MMLQLVMADNYLWTFVGWEGVGLCSYLLIGFWYDEDKNNDAAKKAFIVNRIGDFGFLVAMGAMLYQFGSLNYLDVLGSGSNIVDGTHHVGMVRLSLSSPSCSSSVAPERARRSPSTSGYRTQWLAPRRYPPSSMLPRW
jgi:NADH:ubiquinone oxidoreductase subunit 5 (subunit L)/multisubunit Na+/H+ antiporter MnhA subunit